MIDKAREIALKTLYKIDKDNAYSNIALDEMLNQNRNVLDSKDIGLISEIVYGVTTWKLTLDEIIKKYSNIKLKKISPFILNILRMSIYQIVFLDKIPKSAAVNEGVNLSKRYGHKESSGFVNAILRKVEKQDYEQFLQELKTMQNAYSELNSETQEEDNKAERADNNAKQIGKELEQTNNNEANNREADDKMVRIYDRTEKIVNLISKAYSMPEWIIEELLNEGLTLEKVEDICKNSNNRPNLTIRVNTLKTTREDLKKKLIEKDIEVKDGILWDFLVLNKAKNIENIKEFKEGLFTVQDEVAGLSAIILNPQKNDKILDACSAPGGKTTYLAQIVENGAKTNCSYEIENGDVIKSNDEIENGNIIDSRDEDTIENRNGTENSAIIEAWDVHAHRTKLVEETANRLGINIIKTSVKDATIYEEKYFEKFDKILLDVPCLGIGVLKRKPDIKWQRKKEDIEEIKKLQMNILNNCSKYLKKGGELVYSTCSIFKEENENIVEEFVSKNPNFYIEDVKTEYEKIVEKLHIKELEPNFERNSKDFSKNIKNSKDFEKIIKNSKFFEKYFDKKFLKVYQNEKTDRIFYK